MYYKGETKYEHLVNIKNVPASGAEGGTIEVTELDSPVKQYIDDRKDTPAQDFISKTEQVLILKVQLKLGKMNLVQVQHKKQHYT